MENSFQREVRAVMLPLLRWSPLLVAGVAAAVIFTTRSLRYMTPMYRASGTIQVDNRDFGVENFQIFAEAAVAAGKTPESPETYVSLFASRSLVKRTLDSLGWSLRFFRRGDLRNAELFGDEPFFVRAVVHDTAAFYDKIFTLEYRDDDALNFFKGKKEDGAKAQIVPFEQGFDLENGAATLFFTKNARLLAEKPAALRPGDRFEFQFQSREKMVSEVLANELFVKALNKDGTLLQIAYSDPVPEKTCAFVNGLFRAFIAQSQDAKRRHAAETLAFLDKQLDEVSEKLRGSESGLAGYRARTGLTTAQLEMDAAVKERMTHNLRDVNYDMQKAELKRLFEYLRSGQNLEQFSPNFEALADGVFKDAFIRTQTLEMQKRDLLARYTPTSEEVRTVQGKIENMRTFLHESVGSALQNIESRQKELDRAVAGINQSLQKLPEIQRNEATLERDLRQNEQLYTHLIEKRTALAIAAASDETFHKIVDYPTLPGMPYSPNKPVMVGLAVLSALGLLLPLIYFLFGRTARVRSVADVLHLQTFALMGQVFQLNKKMPAVSQVMEKLVSELDVWLRRDRPKTRRATVISVVSGLPGDGKSFNSCHIARSFARAGKQVLLVDADIRKSDLANLLGVSNSTGLSDIVRLRDIPLHAIKMTKTPGLHLIPGGKFHAGCAPAAISAAFDLILNEMGGHYDLIIVDTPPLEILPDAMPLAQSSDCNLFVCRSGKTPVRVLRRVSKVLADLQTPNVFFVLNAAKPDPLQVQYAKKAAVYREYAEVPEEVEF